MNSLTYISRQFDVLASTTGVSISSPNAPARSAPPSPSNRHRAVINQDAYLNEASSSSSATSTSLSLSMPDIRIRKASQPSSSSLSSSSSSASPSGSNTNSNSGNTSMPRGRSKAQAFLQGPRRTRTRPSSRTNSSNLLHHPPPAVSEKDALAAMELELDMLDPVNVPLPPTPSGPFASLPFTESSSQSSYPSASPHPSQEFLTMRKSSSSTSPSTSSSPSTQSTSSASSMSPAPLRRRRRRRMTVAFLVLRPFVSIWHLLLSAWLWLLGVVGGEAPVATFERRRGSSSSSLNSRSLKKKASSSSILEPSPSDATSPRGSTTQSTMATASESSAGSDDKPDATLVGTDEETDNQGITAADEGTSEIVTSSPSKDLAKSSRMSLSDSRSIGPETDPESFAASASLLLETPPLEDVLMDDDAEDPIPSLLPSSLPPLSSGGQVPPSSILLSSGSTTNSRVRLSLPSQSPSSTSAPKNQSHQRQDRPDERGKLTPWPSEERIRRHASVDSAMANLGAGLGLRGRFLLGVETDEEEDEDDEEEEEDAESREREEQDEEEIDQALLWKRKGKGKGKRKGKAQRAVTLPLNSPPFAVSATIADSSAPSLAPLDLNVDHLQLERRPSKGKGLGKTKQLERSFASGELTVPKTIITPPSTAQLASLGSAPAKDDTDGSHTFDEGKPSEDIVPTPAPAPSPPEAPSALPSKPSQTLLLPNKLGNSYLTASSSRKSNRRASSPSRKNSGNNTYQTLTSPTAGLGSSTGVSAPMVRTKTPFHMPKTLVLDLDETLIHSTSSRASLPSHSSSGGSGGGLFNELGGLFVGGGSGGGFGGMGLFSSGLLAGAGGLLGKGSDRERARAGHMIEVVLNGRSTLYTVYKRPFVDYFLRKVSSWYTLVVFTASMQEYADPVIDWLDGGRGILSRRLFRESCTQLPNGSYAKDLSQIEADLSRVCLLDNSPASYSLDQANGIPIEGWYSDPSDEALLDLLPVLDSLRFTSDVRRVLSIKAF